MHHLEISKEEAEMLLEQIQSDLSDLRMEIASTDSMDFRDKLKEKKELMKGVIQRLNDLLD